MTRPMYFTADITWCNCGCTNTKCDRHISNLNRMNGKGYYRVAAFSGNCPEYRLYDKMWGGSLRW